MEIQAAGLFGRFAGPRLQGRRVLWTFLGDEVGRDGLVNETEKDAFKKVMTVMCTHRLPDLILKVKISGKSSAGRSEELAAPPGRSMPVGTEVVLVEKDSVEWTLHKGAFLVPAKDVLATH
jgi:hypothetical protein